jgi:UDP-2-acetamido-3-amino-2,3-dideoxy-glucuronate N-acetyltransferase
MKGIKNLECFMNSHLSHVGIENGYYYVGEDVRVDPSAVVGPETKLWDGVRVGPHAKLGAFGVYGTGVHIEANVIMGDYCKIQRGVTLYDGVEVEDYVFFGPNATTTNDRNPRSFGDWKKSSTVFRIGASIGANATIIAGNEIGALSLIGAGSVVSKPVAAGHLVVGNPARFAGWVSTNGTVISRELEMPESVKKMLRNPLQAIRSLLENEVS